MNGTTLLHASDLHFGIEVPAVCEGLRRLVDMLQPDALVVSGDLTQRATAAQFERARVFLDTLGARPRLLLPGNHDIPLWNLPARIFHPWRAWKAACGPELEPSLDMEGFQISGVLTARPWRHQGGVISAGQRERVAERLARCPIGRWPVVVTHHPVQVLHAGQRVDRAWGGRAALERWALAGQPVLLGGHTHDPFIRRWSSDPGDPDAPGAWIVQSGTAVSARLRRGRPQSVTLLRTRPGASTSAGRPMLQVIRYDWDGRSFQRAGSHSLGADGRSFAMTER